MTRNEKKLTVALIDLVKATATGEGVPEAMQAAKAAQAEIDAHHPPHDACIDYCEACENWTFQLDGSCTGHGRTRPANETFDMVMATAFPAAWQAAKDAIP